MKDRQNVDKARLVLSQPPDPDEQPEEFETWAKEMVGAMFGIDSNFEWAEDDEE